MIETVWGSTEKPVSSNRLAEVLSAEGDLAGVLYIGYPIIGTPEGSFPIDALFISPLKGIVLIDLVEGKTLTDYARLQDDSYNKMLAKLLQHPALIRKRELQVKPKTLTFAPAITQLPNDDEHPICNSENVVSAIKSLDNIDNQYFPTLVAVIQAISTLRRGRKKRELRQAESRGAKIKQLEDSIANLDSQQSAAVVETFEGVQRIRGLAGCGKTIVLALKVAYLHARHPDWLIAVTFNTRSLKKQFERLITTFVLEQANEEPDWEKIRILNAWGAPGGVDRTGIYYEFCRDHGVEYLDFNAAKGRVGSDKAFEYACDAALQGVKAFVPSYDAILVDEAQDFAPSFLLLCYEYLKYPKRLVYAYDELQNLGHRSLPPVEDIFGKNPDGSPRVIITPPEAGKPKQDIILDRCYRNSRPVLSTAHALGFGIYREGGLVQIFENKNLWFDIGYEAHEGEIEDGQSVTLRRTPDSSPSFLESHSHVDDLIQFLAFETPQEQTSWLVSSIQKNIREEELLPEDVVVINPDPLTTKAAVGQARQALFQLGINSNLAGVTTIPDVFIEPGTITFTGIFRAKGNEAAMVYIINAQDCLPSLFSNQVALARNRLFTAITRSKAWVRVLGVGRDMLTLKAEFERAKAENFSLKFRYPTEEERKTMRTVNRDMSLVEIERNKKRRVNFKDIIDSLESGETVIEDYPDELVRKFHAYLSRKDRRKKNDTQADS